MSGGIFLTSAMLGINRVLENHEKGNIFQGNGVNKAIRSVVVLHKWYGISGDAFWESRASPEIDKNLASKIFPLIKTFHIMSEFMTR